MKYYFDGIILICVCVAREVHTKIDWSPRKK